MPAKRVVSSHISYVADALRVVRIVQRQLRNRIQDFFAAFEPFSTAILFVRLNSVLGALSQRFSVEANSTAS